MVSEKESTSRNFAPAIALMVCLPLLYAFSLGPVGWLARRAGVHVDYVLPAYAPVVWLRDHTPLKGAIDWYADLWGVH